MKLKEVVRSVDLRKGLTRRHGEKGQAVQSVPGFMSFQSAAARHYGGAEMGKKA